MKSTSSAFLSFALLALTEGSAAVLATGPIPVQFGTNIELSSDLPASLSQREPTIAANPKSPKNLVAGFFGRATSGGTRNCWFVSTFDGGSTWTFGGAVPLSSSFDACADPALAADGKGNFYYAYLDAIGTPQGFINTTTDVRVAKSTDGGKTFPEFVTVVTGGSTSGTPDPDKTYITVDAQPKSPFNGTIYLTYTDFPAANALVRVTVSRDGGRTWSNPVTLDSVDITRGIGPASEAVTNTLPVVAPNGTVFVFYLHFNQAKTISSIRYAKSQDGGTTWSPPIDVAANLPTPGFFLLNDGSPDFGTSSAGGIFVITYPTAAIAPDGTIYVAWTDFPNGSCTQASVAMSGVPSCINADVRLSVSRDGGRSWTSPLKVSDDSTANDQFFPWIATGPDGLLSLIWLDRRLDPNNVDYDAFYTNTADGKIFLPNVRVSSATSKVDTTYAGGDYNNLVVTSQGIFPVWNDTRFTTATTSSRIFATKGVLTP